MMSCGEELGSWDDAAAKRGRRWHMKAQGGGRRGYVARRPGGTVAWAARMAHEDLVGACCLGFQMAARGCPPTGSGLQRLGLDGSGRKGIDEGGVGA